MNDDEPTEAPKAPSEQKNATTAQAEGLRSTDGEPIDLPNDLDLSPGEFPQTSSASSDHSLAGQPAMVPQMLLRYFNRTTNGTTFISVPVEFTPPGAPAVKSSSATYISP